MRRRTFIIGSVAASAAGLTSARPGPARAQAWPSRAIKGIVPLSPGSGADVVGRIVMEEVAKALGQPIVIENRPGAGNLIGMTAVAKSDPDGYTILLNSSTHTVTTAIREKLPLDTVKELSPIVPLGSLPLVLIVNAKSNYKTLADLVAYAKANPGKINYASAGAGNQSHLTAEMFRIAAGYEGVHLPFKGSPEAVMEVVSGRADFYVCPTSSAIPIIRDGQARGLAVTGQSRLAGLPDVPTFAEAGYTASIFGSWIGVFVPSATPAPIKERLYTEITKALALPAVAKKLDDIGIGKMPLTSAQFDALVREEIESYTRIAIATKVRMP